MAWFEGAIRRPIKHNFKVGGMIRPLHGLVLHIEEGAESGTRGWFNMSLSQRQHALEAAWVKHGSHGRRPKAFASSAHFGNPKKGPLEQFVNTNNMALAQKAGNSRWISVENEGKTGDSLTPSQIANVADLLGWLCWHENVPLQLAENPFSFGLGYHAMGGKAWGGHDRCPGKPILDQRLLIIERARIYRPPGFHRIFVLPPEPICPRKQRSFMRRASSMSSSLSRKAPVGDPGRETA